MTGAAHNPQERLACLRLARTPGIGPMNFAQLLGQYGTAQRALKALPDRLRRVGRTVPPIPTSSEMEDEIAVLENLGARPLLRSDPDYPLLLTHVPDAPPLLYVRGDVSLLSRGGVGIVGARNASAAGIRLAESLSAELALSGQCVVSGLARGIDTAAHEAALHPGLTVAALAGGLDQPYPPENAQLQEKIAQQGCLVTEAPPGTIPQARHFPRRNRLIAGITAATLVIEAAERSGTLITARLATEYGRVVMAVPGSPLDPRSRGGNQLIKNGAVLVENNEDILEALPGHLPARQPAPWQNIPLPPLFENVEKTTSDSPCDAPPFSSIPTVPETPAQHPVSWKNPSAPPTPDETSSPSTSAQDPQETALSLKEQILPLLSHTPIAVDEVVTRCQFSVSTVMTVLSELELDGLVACQPGGQVMRLPERP